MNTMRVGALKVVLSWDEREIRVGPGARVELAFDRRAHIVVGRERGEELLEVLAREAAGATRLTAP